MPAAQASLATPSFPCVTFSRPLAAWFSPACVFHSCECRIALVKTAVRRMYLDVFTWRRVNTLSLFLSRQQTCKQAGAPA